MRLQKFLADAGVASRRKCEPLIAGGRVTVNGETAHIGMNVDPDNDIVLLDGKRVSAGGERIVLAFFKPKNVICSNSDSEDRVKVTDYFKDLPYRLYTIGRLDYDSEGLILVTNDGDLANKLMHPSYGTTKTYRVICAGSVSKAQLRRLETGIMLDDGMTAPAQARLIREYDGKTELLITLHEGRNRQVRRMLAALGHDTLRLSRIAIGTLGIDGLKPGMRRKLTDEEISSLT